MSNDKRYNGWTNYETWNLALWLGNDSGSYDYWQEQTQEAYKNADSSRSFTKREQAALDLADILEAEIEEQAPEVTGFYADILSAAMSEVNYHEIAEHWLDDADLIDECELCGEPAGEGNALCPACQTEAETNA
jgi:hypothetical protein